LEALPLTSMRGGIGMNSVVRTSNRRRRRHLGARLAAAAVFVVAALPVSVSAAQPSGLPHAATDVTATAEGARLIKEAKNRFASRGVSGELKAIKDGAGITIAPF
jgi:hypothetical protein